MAAGYWTQPGSCPNRTCSATLATAAVLFGALLLLAQFTALVVSIVLWARATGRVAAQPGGLPAALQAGTIQGGVNSI
jgi:hypothetical protein